MAPTVGFIGLGTMGMGMARNLAKAGFPLLVSNRTFSKAQALAKELEGSKSPVRAVRSHAGIGREAPVGGSAPPASREGREGHLGEGGPSSGAKPGTIVIDSSTIAAEAAQEIAKGLSERGVLFLDAPVSGGQKGAIEGTLTFFVG